MNAHLLDVLRLLGNLPTDAALAQKLRVDRPRICNVRAGRRAVGDPLMIVINEEFDMPIAEIKALIGKGRAK